MQNSNFSYTSFGELLPFDTNQRFLQLMVEISTGIVECDESEKQIQLVTDLRRMRKYHLDLFKTTFSNILMKFINNILYKDEPEVVFHGLILVSEILGFYDFEVVNDWVQDLIQITLDLSTSPEMKIKEMANLALYNAGNNMFFIESFQVLFENLIEREEEVSSNATQTLKYLIHSSDENNLAYCYDWSEIFSQVLNSINKSEYRGNIEKLREIIFLIQQKIKENFESEVINKLHPDGQHILKNLLEAGSQHQNGQEGH
jgi:hypothetical protein